jgi:hypothetical protein
MAPAARDTDRYELVATIVNALVRPPGDPAASDYTILYRAAPAGLTAVLMPRPDEA